MIRFFCQNSTPHFLTAEHMQFQQLMLSLGHPEIPNQLDLKPLRLLQHQTQGKPRRNQHSTTSTPPTIQRNQIVSD
ncbi:hypothetical protein EKS18_01245 [Streptococcus mutans]|nr:hypothetical protein [Streptococcus mutans]